MSISAQLSMGRVIEVVKLHKIKVDITELQNSENKDSVNLHIRKNFRKSIM